MADRGVTGRRMSGGTNRVADGPGPMSRTSRSPSRLRTAPSRALAASTASLVTIRSSCKPTARRGCSHLLVFSTGRCLRTTNRASRRCETPSIASRQKNPARQVLVRRAARPAGLAAAVMAPEVTSYTAVLLSDTATPTWQESYRQLPFAFVGSAAASSGGAGLIYAHRADADPARRMAVGGAIVDVAALYAMEQSLGPSSTPDNSPPMTRSTRSRRSGNGSRNLAAEPLLTGAAGAWLRAGKILTGLGGVGAAVSRRSRALSIASGAALLGGSICTRFKRVATTALFQQRPRSVSVGIRQGPTRSARSAARPPRADRCPGRGIHVLLRPAGRQIWHPGPPTSPVICFSAVAAARRRGATSPADPAWSRPVDRHAVPNRVRHDLVPTCRSRRLVPGGSAASAPTDDLGRMVAAGTLQGPIRALRCRSIHRSPCGDRATSSTCPPDAGVLEFRALTRQH